MLPWESNLVWWIFASFYHYYFFSLVFVLINISMLLFLFPIARRRGKFIRRSRRIFVHVKHNIKRKKKGFFVILSYFILTWSHDLIVSFLLVTRVPPVHLSIMKDQTRRHDGARASNVAFFRVSPWVLSPCDKLLW